MDCKAGVYKLVGSGIGNMDVDEAFARVHADVVERWRQDKRASRPADTACIAVADSGYFTDLDYLGRRTVSSVDFTGGYTLAQLTRGTPRSTGMRGSPALQRIKFDHDEQCKRDERQAGIDSQTRNGPPPSERSKANSRRPPGSKPSCGRHG